MSIYVKLIWAYLKIGLFGFGGGYAMLSLIQREVASRRGISRSYVSRLEKRAVCKLANAMNPPPPD